MYAVQYEYRVRAEINEKLLREAEYERWLHGIGPLRTSSERLGQRLVRQAREWLASRDSLVPCNIALPECGLTPV
jgi:hypothetical protein